MVRFSFSFILIFFFSVACQNEQDSTNSIPRPIRLNEQSLILQEDDVHKPFVFTQVIDTFLVLIRQNEPFIKVYGLNSLQPIAELGYKGEGNEEFLRAPSFVKDASVPMDSGDEELVVFDSGKSRIGFLDLKMLSADQHTFRWQKVNPPASWDFVSNVYAVAGNTILATAAGFSISMPRASKFSVLDIETGSDFHIQIRNQPEYTINENILATVFLSSAGIQPDLGLMVAAPLFFPRLDFYDLNGQYVYSSTYDDPGKNADVYVEGISEANRTNALSRYKGAIYVFYSDAERIIVGSFQSPIDRSRIWEKMELLLRVFDWEGNHLETYSIQANGNSSFTFDKVNKRFIVYDNSDDGNNLKSFNIPPIN